MVGTVQQILVSIGHLAYRAWLQELTWRSASTFGLLIEWITPVLVFSGTLLCIRKGWLGMSSLKALVKDLAKTTAVTIAMLALLAFAVFLVAIPVTIHSDHEALLNRIKTLHNENAKLVDPKSRDNRITELEAQVEELKGVGHVPIRTPALIVPALDPDSFYQFGKVVATVDGAVEDLPNSKIHFRVVRPNAILNPDKDVQYREWTLRCVDGGKKLPSARMPEGTFAGTVIPGAAVGWSCSIVGKS
jgi:hypothetical protein